MTLPSQFFNNFHPNNWIFGNNSVLIIKNIIIIVTSTSGCIKYTYQMIIFIYRLCTLPHFWFFGWRDIITTYFNISFVTVTHFMHVFSAMTFFPLLCFSSTSSLVEISVFVVSSPSSSLNYLLSPSPSFNFFSFSSI